MDEIERVNSPCEPTHSSYRLSWTAYVAPLLLGLISLLVSLAIAWGAISNPLKNQPFWLYISISLTIFLIGLLVSGYKIIYLKSVNLYTDSTGVWLYRGVFPWNRGTVGVKWRDIDEALCYNGFFNWIFRSYTVRVRHRFTKSSEVYVPNVAQGHKATGNINSLLQSYLDSNRAEERAIEAR